MKPIYTFEKELLEEFDFEPINDGYSIDDLNEKDRAGLSGMLWAFYSTIRNWKDNCEEENEASGTIGQIYNEYLNNIYECLENDFLSDVNDFVISTLDSYSEEEEKNDEETSS